MKKFTLLNVFSHIAKDSIVCSHPVPLIRYFSIWDALYIFKTSTERINQENNKNVYLEGERGNRVKRRKETRANVAFLPKYYIIILFILIILNIIVIYYILNKLI